MTKNDKIEFVKSILSNMSNRLIEDVEKNKVPENWDGIELRWWIEQRARSLVMNDKQSKRYREFENTVIVNNL